MEKIELEFEGIDSWNRPIFKDCKGNRFGSTNRLFEYRDTFENVMKTLTTLDICYFGKHFDCEPMGITIDPVKIKLVKKFTE